jgi:hypothetical protein
MTSPVDALVQGHPTVGGGAEERLLIGIPKKGRFASKVLEVIHVSNACLSPFFVR